MAKLDYKTRSEQGSTWTRVEITIMLDHYPVQCSVVYTWDLNKQPGDDCQSFPALLHWRFIKESMIKVIITLLHKSCVAEPLHSSALRFSETLPFALVKKRSQYPIYRIFSNLQSMHEVRIQFAYCRHRTPQTGRQKGCHQRC